MPPLERMAGRAKADLVADFAGRIPSAVICELLGVPQEDREMVRGLSASLVRLLDPVPLSPAELAHLDGQHRQASAYLDRLFEQRRREPREDLTSRLVQAEEQGDRLSAAELTDNVLLLFTAGFDTTEGLMGNALAALMRHPGQMAALRADPSLMGKAVEECLRFDSSVQLSSRQAMEETEIAGRTIPQGAAVVCVLGSANRDPAVYPDPDRFDVTRSDIRPVSFGGGIHHCLGAMLAKLETEIALGRILNRFPGLRPDPGEKPVRRRSMSIRAFARLPVLL